QLTLDRTPIGPHCHTSIGFGWVAASTIGSLRRPESVLESNPAFAPRRTIALNRERRSSCALPSPWEFGQFPCSDQRLVVQKPKWRLHHLWRKCVSGLGRKRCRRSRRPPEAFERLCRFRYQPRPSARGHETLQIAGDPLHRAPWRSCPASIPSPSSSRLNALPVVPRRFSAILAGSHRCAGCLF